jgi:hypothetical protein
LASITNQADTVNGYDDGGGSWLNENGRNYVWDNTGTGTEQNFAGFTFDGSALASGDTTVTAADIDWTWDTDNSGTSMTIRYRCVDAANPAQWSGSNLPENATYLGSGNEVTEVINPSTVSGAHTSPSLVSLFQALLDSQGAANIGNINVSIWSDTTTGEYCSIDGTANILLTITVTGGGGLNIPGAMRTYRFRRVL